MAQWPAISLQTNLRPCSLCWTAPTCSEHNNVPKAYISIFLASGRDLGLSEMVETRGLDHIQTTENAAKMAKNESKWDVKRIENRKILNENWYYEI